VGRGSPYPRHVRRIVIVGNSGSGKTTLAGIVAARLDVPHVELDAHFHRAGWEPTPAPEFRAAVWAALDSADAVAGGWVVCGNYRAVRSAVWARADTIVWLDLPRRHVMLRVSRRSLSRVARGEELWNGNRESLRNVLALHEPERSIIRWAWGGVHRYRRQYEPMMSDPLWAGLGWYRLDSPRAVQAWIDGLG